MAKDLIYDINDKPKFSSLLVFALQQVLAILAATVLVPAIIGNGMSQSAALFGAGVGTLIYQLFTKFKSPVFLGSSFAFIGSMLAAFGGAATASAGYAGIILGAIFAGLVYVVIASIIKFAGVAWINKLMPTVVVGPTVALIGLSLAVNAVKDLTVGKVGHFESTFVTNVTPSTTTTTSSASTAASGINSVSDAIFKADMKERDFMLKSTMGSETKNEYWEYSKKASQAWKEGNYIRAISAVKGQIRTNTLDINLAADYVSLAMLQWNQNYKASAKASMRKAIEVMRTGKYIGNSSCEERAVIFLKKMENDELPESFNSDDTKSYGVLGYIMEVPRAAYNKKIQELNHRSDVLALYASSMSKSYRMQGESQARRAKLSAGAEYQKATGKTFSPDAPPPSGSSSREAWESCKKIYDIFK